jgi:hypothetical protein
VVPQNARPAPAAVLPLPQPAVVAAAPPPIASPPPSSNAAAAVFSSTPAAPPVAKAPVVVDSRTYSAADLDVEEPVLLSTRPVLPSQTSRSGAATVRTFELVIDAGGSVQSSKLIDGDGSFFDSFLPQQYKLLKFRPATRQGRPVKYLYKLRVTSRPE